MGVLAWVNEYFSIGPMVTTFFIGFVTVILLYLYISSKHSYWKKLGVPHVTPIPLFGSLLDIARKPQQDVELERYKKHGAVYGHYEGNRPLISVAEPELLRGILVKDFPIFSGRRKFETGDRILKHMLSVVQGEDWKRIRTIVTPTFSTGKIKRLLGIFKDCAKTLVNNFKEAAEKKEPVEAKRFFGAFVMDVIASSAFSTKIDSHNNPDNEFAKTLRENFAKKNWRFFLFFLFPSLVKFLRIEIANSKGMTFFEEVTKQIIEERKRTGTTRNDFLQLLLDTAKEVSEEGKLDTSSNETDIAENYGKEENDVIFKNIVSKKNLSFIELVAQCVIFFLAGYDTTASTLSFITYCLALNPDVQEKLIQELDNAVKENNGDLNYEAIQSMKYLDNVISETLRLYPPGVKLERVAEADYKLGNTNITIPKGMTVTIPVYAIHRNPKVFPDPEKFDPNRWLPEERAKREQFTYLPFGAGPRNCVAMRFALMEIKVCLAHVFSNFRVKKCSKTKVPLNFAVGSLTLRAEAVDVLFEKREDKLNVL